MWIKLNNYTFVKKAVYGVDKADQVKPSSTNSQLGSKRPNSKYIKRENKGNGEYRYVYEEAKGSKAPSDKDTQMMAEEFRSAMQSDNYWKKFEKHFEDTDFMSISNAMAARGEELTPEAFIAELENVREILGVKASKYLPTPVAAKEYKKMLSMAGSQPSEYNRRLDEGMSKKQLDSEKETDAQVTGLMSMGFNEQQIEDFKKNPTKVKATIEKLKNFLGGK